ncbi:hypothetical protein HF285_10940 [Acidithiobacillus ferrooxidans F221]|uniref:DEAD/DEAH box helicase n=1 Tax=Acidithiobacillus ferrooxidans TaxID=920 RepID=UPI001D03D664|nr:DNA primase small subunit domain-containing protein [Acidithiobacillus ferrooxidans]MBU2808757.1 hypothetical protein [Acidithiobacillus ferrooxidans F221]
MADSSELTAIQAENARLIALLEAHGIEWRLPQPVAAAAQESEPSRLSTAEKVALFRRRFRGRTDVYPIRWEGKTSGKSGYAPACANEWRAGVCEKPRIKCGDCSNRLLIPLSDAVIYDHLAGEHTVGVYPLLEDDTCYFLAVDFDEADWRDDARAFMQSCHDLSVPAALEISRSGNGAHAWVFFASRVSARDARRLGTAIISHTCSRTRQLKLESYDRLFPNQDTMPKGGLGNLIALPLQKWPRESGYSVFVDTDLRPYPDQWAFLASIQPLAAHDIEPTILRATGGVHPLDVTFIDEEDLATPWKRETTSAKKLFGPIRYTASKPAGAPHDLEVLPRSRFTRIDLPTDAGIQDVFRHLANDQARTEAIAAEVRDAVGQGRKVLVLTERTEHLDAIKTALDGLEPAPFVLHGRMSRKQRAALVADLDALAPDAPRVLLSTGKLVGEGFDHPPLDTLVLAMPVSWKGTLQQYAGRLHREHASKTDVRIIDFVDTGHPALLRMWDKRQRGYRAMGYRLDASGAVA